MNLWMWNNWRNICCWLTQCTEKVMISHRCRPWHVNGYFRMHVVSAVVRLGLWLGLCIVRNGLVSKHLTVKSTPIVLGPCNQYNLIWCPMMLGFVLAEVRVCHPPIFTFISIFKPANFLKGTYDMNNERSLTYLTVWCSTPIVTVMPQSTNWFLQLPCCCVNFALGHC